METEQDISLHDFCRILLEAERAGVQAISDILLSLADGELKSALTGFLHHEGMNCQIFITLIKNMGQEPGSRTGDFIEKIRALKTTEEKLKLLIRGQEWVARQIRYNRGLFTRVSDVLFLEAIKVQHEENVDMLNRMLSETDIKI